MTSLPARTTDDVRAGSSDDLPTDAFYFSGDMAEIRANVGRTLKFGPVTRPPRAQLRCSRFEAGCPQRTVRKWRARHDSNV
jgi:hypothetical protein